MKKGEIYAKNPAGGPILPIFRTAEIPKHLLDEIKYLTMEEDQDLYGRTDLMAEAGTSGRKQPLTLRALFRPPGTIGRPFPKLRKMRV